MSFVADHLVTERDLEQAALLEAVAPDYYDGAADFAFGYMPKYPTNQVYMSGWLDKLQATVPLENDHAVYPVAHYKVVETSDRNAQIFAGIDEPPDEF